MTKTLRLPGVMASSPNSPSLIRRLVPPERPAGGHRFNRVAYAAAHVVVDPWPTTIHGSTATSMSGRSLFANISGISVSAWRKPWTRHSAAWPRLDRRQGADHARAIGRPQSLGFVDRLWRRHRSSGTPVPTSPSMTSSALL